MTEKEELAQELRDYAKASGRICAIPCDGDVALRELAEALTRAADILDPPKEPDRPDGTTELREFIDAFRERAWP